MILSLRMTGRKSSKSLRFGDLTDDLLVDILLWVPAKSLHRFKCVSKRWHSLISAPSFARAFILTAQHHHHLADRLLLFKIYRKTGLGQVHALPLLDNGFVKASALPITFDFIPPLNQLNCDITPTEGTDRALRNMHEICTYGGLVLLKGLFEDQYPRNAHRYFHYYLCNPITKKWVELPLIRELDFVGFTCYYVQQTEGQAEDSRIWADASSYENIIRHNASFDPNKIEFTVVSIKWDAKKDVFIAYVFSSNDDAPEWSIFHVPRPSGFRWTSSQYIKRKVVFVNGKFHWRGENCIAAYDPFNNPLHCDIIQLPTMDPLTIHALFVEVSTLEECDGRLRLVIMFLRHRFVAWDLVDYANKVWVKQCEVKDYSYLTTDFHSFVSDADRDKVYKVTDANFIMMFDLKKKSRQLVYCPPNLDNVHRLRYVQPFMSSLWPTTLPLLQQNKK